ncbi:MAG: peptidylprolyl isomerase [Hyphomonadaceae bacterium]
MRKFTTFAAAASLMLGGVACAQSAQEREPLATTAAQPAPVESHWREVDPDDLVLIETVHGTTVLELNISFAPKHAKRFRQMVRAGAYDGEYFYRVIDGFVAQAGLQDEDKISEWPPLTNENDRSLSFEPFTPLGNNDLFAQKVGHTGTGFAMARDTELAREWLLHCPGAVAMARDNDPDSGGTEFYVALDAQRYLDRNLTVFARVIDGMQYLQKLERGDRAIASGVIQAPRTGDEMISVRLGSDIAEADRPTYLVMRTRSDAFEAAKTARRVRTADFFYRTPPAILDICDFQVPVRKVGE